MAKKQKLKFDKREAKSAKKIRENSAKGSGFGNMLWIKADDSKLVRILAEPNKWLEYNYVGLELNDNGDKMPYRKLPTFDGYAEAFPGTAALRVRTSYAIPVVEIDESGKLGDRVMFYEPGQKVLNSLLNRFDRRKTLTDCDLEIIREGSGMTTTYDLNWEDKKKRPAAEKLLSKIPDLDEDLLRMVTEAEQEFFKTDEDDEDEAPKKKGKKSKAAKKRQMRDEEEDDEDEDSDDEEEDEEPEDDDEDESEDDDESDDEDDDDEEEEDDDEEDDDEDDDSLPSASDIEDLDFKGLKALAEKHGVKVKAGSKSAGFRKALLAWLEEQDESDDDDDDGDEGDGDDDGEDRVDSTFIMSNIDEDAFTVDLEDADGNEYETVYLDRGRDDVTSYKEGAKYKFVIELDEQEDWVAVTQPEAVAKKGGKKPGKKGKGKSK